MAVTGAILARMPRISGSPRSPQCRMWSEPSSNGSSSGRSSPCVSERMPICISEAYLDANARIEVITQRIADEVEAEHGEGHGQGREEHEVRRVEEMRTRVVEHRSPAWRGRWDAQAEEAERSLGEDDAAHADGSLHQQRLHHVGQDVTKEDAQAARSQSTRRFNIFALLYGHD